MNHVTVECDGVDYTKRLSDYGTHSVLILNIASYAGGTKPWNSKTKGRQEVVILSSTFWNFILC
jgi:hypothetical protein